MNTCDHTKFSYSWRDCDLHTEVECFATTCDNCNQITTRDCEEECAHEEVRFLDCAHCKGTEACNVIVCVDCGEEVNQ